MYRVALTGGIASGKTTATEQFQALGISVIDADIVSRELVAPGSPILQKIADEFGPQILSTTGELDRKQLRKIVFGNPDKRLRLEAILHPAIRRRMLELADQAQSPYALLAIPLLAENPDHYPVDRVLLIDTPEALQIKRLMSRDKTDEKLAKQMLEAQATRQQRQAIADDIIVNQGDLATFREQITQYHQRYLALASEAKSQEPN